MKTSNDLSKLPKKERKKILEQMGQGSGKKIKQSHIWLVTKTIRQISKDLLEGASFDKESMAIMIRAMITFIKTTITPTEEDEPNYESIGNSEEANTESGIEETGTTHQEESDMADRQ